MKLTEIENPTVRNWRKPLKIKVRDKVYNVIGYTPELMINGEKYPPHWHVETRECMMYVLDAEIV